MLEAYPRRSASARHGAISRIRGDVLRDLDLARPDAGSRRPAAALVVSPGDVRHLQVAFLIPPCATGRTVLAASCSA